MIRPRTTLLVLLPLALAACNSSKPSGTAGSAPGATKVRVAFVTNNPDPFWSIVEAGCNKAAGEVGAEVVFRKPPSGDPAAQQEIIESLVNNGLKAISVSVIDPKNQTAYLNEV